MTPARRTARRTPVTPLLALLLAACLALAGCSGGSGGSSSGAGGAGGSGAGTDASGEASAEASGETETLTVLAASSLTEVFATLADDFEQSHPGVTVETSFGSSTDLAGQAADGAPGDVLATADPTSMQLAQGAEVVASPEAFAANTLVLVVPADDPAGISSLDDLEGTTWVRCADEVPCGRVALEVLADNDVTAEPASLEDDAKSTLEKVVSGEADAGLVYATDALAAGDAVRTIEIPGAENRQTAYLIATLEQSAAPELAQEWVDLVLSEEGQQAMRDAGFVTQ